MDDFTLAAVRRLVRDELAAPLDELRRDLERELSKQTLETLTRVADLDRRLTDVHTKALHALTRLQGKAHTR